VSFPESTAQWSARLAREAIAQGRHIPKAWETEFDDGADGCMPTGWYLFGLDEHGCRITFPVRHEYGPFSTQEKAGEHGRRIEVLVPQRRRSPHEP